LRQNTAKSFPSCINGSVNQIEIAEVVFVNHWQDVLCFSNMHLWILVHVLVSCGCFVVAIWWN
jgi:hypothetical protein